MINCNNYEQFNGTDYNGIFVGGYTGNDPTIIFKNCNNYGDLKTTYAALFLGNTNSSNTLSASNVTVENCKNYGTVTGTSGANVFGVNGTTATHTTLNETYTIESINDTCVIDGVTYTGIIAKVDPAYVVAGNVTSDASIVIEDVTLTDDAQKFGVTMNGYASSTGGTWGVGVSYTFDSVDEMNDAKVRYGTIIDSVTFTETYPDAQTFAPTWDPTCSAGITDHNYSVATVDGKFFYVMEIPNHNYDYTINGTPRTTMTAFDSNNSIIASVSAVVDSSITYPSIEASIDGVAYFTLSDALTNANDGDTITIVQDCSIGDTQITKDITLDLNDKTVTFTESFGFRIETGATLTVIDSGVNGAITSDLYYASIFYILYGGLDLQDGYFSTTYGYSGDNIIYAEGSDDPDAENYTVITIGEDATLSCDAGWAIGILGKAGNNSCCYGLVLDINGTITGDSQNEYGINSLTTNGNIQSVDGNVLQITFGENSNIDGTIYLAGYGEYTVDGGTFNKGIEIKAGELVVNDGTFVGSEENGHDPNTGATSTYGYALAVVNNASYANGAVTINGGVFDGLAEVVDDSNPVAGKISLTITGGAFKYDPTEYLTSLYASVSNGDYYIVARDLSATVNLGDSTTPYALIVDGDEYFVEPSAEILVDDETVTGVLTYSYGNVFDATYEEIIAEINTTKPEADTFVVNYSLTFSGNFTGSINGEITMAYSTQEIEYTVSGNTIYAILGTENIGKLSVLAPQDLVYDGSSKIATIYNENMGILGSQDIVITYEKDGVAYNDIPSQAGTYTATISADDVNGDTYSASITYSISKKSVNFTVTNNVFETGNYSAPIITNEEGLVEDIDYVVVYIDENSAQVDLSTAEAGVYSVLIDVINANYKLVGEVGSVVVFENQAPETYTLSFNAGSGDSIADYSGIATTVYTLPTATSQLNETFTGWSYDGKIYSAGSEFIQPENDVTLIATWSTNAIVEGKLYDQNGNTISGAYVTFNGTTQITTEIGGFIFGSVAVGNYDLTAQY